MREGDKTKGFLQLYAKDNKFSKDSICDKFGERKFIWGITRTAIESRRKKKQRNRQWKFKKKKKVEEKKINRITINGIAKK